MLKKSCFTETGRGEACHLSVTLVTGHTQRSWHCDSPQITNDVWQTTQLDSKGENTVNKWRKGWQESVDYEGNNTAALYWSTFSFQLSV